jgi:surface antigen
MHINRTRLNEHAKQRAVERGVMAADTTWDAQWNEHYKACAFRALFQPSPTLTEMYCRQVDKFQQEGGNKEGAAGGREARPLEQSSVGIHVRTGGLAGWLGGWLGPEL